MDTTKEPERPAPRTIVEIFGDLRALAQSDGALHAISGLIYRDWLVTVDVQDGRIVDDPAYRWSITKLNKNELMLLVGLLVQSTSDRTYTVRAGDGIFAARADELLREFHDRVLLDGIPIFDREAGKFTDRPDSVGLMAREAIYYGSDSFYAVTRRIDAKAVRAAEVIGAKHKYDTKSDRWYVVLDSIDTGSSIDALFPLVWPWREDENEAMTSEEVGRMFNSRGRAVTVGDAARKRLEKH